MIKGFEFQEGGRDYSCTVEQQFGQDGEHWWWFNVSGDGQRYAPFQASRDDTRTSVQKRIVQFYEHRLWVRAQPVQRGAQFGSRPAAAKPAPAAVEAVAPAPAVPAKKVIAKAVAKSPAKAAKKPTAKPAAKASTKKRSAARA
jgi:hypothetical protein